MNRTPITINGAWCPTCGNFIALWEQKDGEREDVFIAEFACRLCGTRVQLSIAYDDLDRDDRPNMEVVS